MSFSANEVVVVLNFVILCFFIVSVVSAPVCFFGISGVVILWLSSIQLNHALGSFGDSLNI